PARGDGVQPAGGGAEDVGETAGPVRHAGVGRGRGGGPVGGGVGGHAGPAGGFYGPGGGRGHPGPGRRPHPRGLESHAHHEIESGRRGGLPGRVGRGRGDRPDVPDAGGRARAGGLPAAGGARGRAGGVGRVGGAAAGNRSAAQGPAGHPAADEGDGGGGG